MTQPVDGPACAASDRGASRPLGASCVVPATHNGCRPRLRVRSRSLPLPDHHETADRSSCRAGVRGTDWHGCDTSRLSVGFPEVSGARQCAAHSTVGRVSIGTQLELLAYFVRGLRLGRIKCRNFLTHSMSIANSLNRGNSSRRRTCEQGTRQGRQQRHAAELKDLPSTRSTADGEKRTKNC